MPIIQVENLTKEFRLGQMESLRTSLLNQARRLIGTPVLARPEFVALDNLTFSVEAGEVVGVIGHNGAGKSTLLKVISGITSPTSGRISAKGRIAPLIEVGAGFVPDLTGRENVYLNGSILGLSRKNIDRKFDEIVEFAEMEQFIDTPVKRYSSGMKVKLAFSVATSIDSEILIVDEVLAVGDLAFQRKCFDRMEDLIRRQGRTVLLVSHNIRQVERLCGRVLLLSKGSILKDGDSRAVCDYFYHLSNEAISTRKIAESSLRVRSSGELSILAVNILDSEGGITNKLAERSTLRIRIEFELLEELVNPEFHVGTHTTDFVYLTGESTAVLGGHHEYAKGSHVIEQVIPECPFAPGTYGIRFAALDRNGRVLFNGENLTFFSVEPQDDSTPLQDELRILSVPVEWILQGERHCSDDRITPRRLPNILPWSEWQDVS